MKALNQRVNIQLVNQLVLIEVKDVKGYPKQTLCFVIINQFFDQFDIAVKILRIMELRELGDDPLSDGTFVPSTNGSAQIPLRQPRPVDQRGRRLMIPVHPALGLIPAQGYGIKHQH